MYSVMIRGADPWKLVRFKSILDISIAFVRPSVKSSSAGDVLFKGWKCRAQVKGIKISKGQNLVHRVRSAVVNE